MKLWNYMFLFTGISVLFALSGMQIAGISELLKIIGVNITNTGISSFNVQNTLWDKIFGLKGILTSLGAVSAVGIGGYLYSKDKSFLIIPLITGVSFFWGSVIVSLVQQKGGYGVFGIVLGIVGIALTVGFIQSCVDYFLGVG